MEISISLMPKFPSPNEVVISAVLVLPSTSIPGVSNTNSILGHGLGVLKDESVNISMILCVSASSMNNLACPFIKFSAVAGITVLVSPSRNLGKVIDRLKGFFGKSGFLTIPLAAKFAIVVRAGKNFASMLFRSAALILAASS